MKRIALWTVFVVGALVSLLGITLSYGDTQGLIFLGLVMVAFAVWRLER